MHLTIFAPSLSFVSVLVLLLPTNLLQLFKPSLIILDGTLFNTDLIQVDIFYNSTTNVIRGIRFSFTNDSAVAIGEYEDTYNHSIHSFNYTGYGVLSYFKVYMRGSEMVKLEAFWMRWCQCFVSFLLTPFFFKKIVLKMSIKFFLSQIHELFGILIGFCVFRPSSALEHLDTKCEGLFQWILQGILRWQECLPILSD